MRHLDNTSFPPWSIKVRQGIVKACPKYIAFIKEVSLIVWFLWMGLNPYKLYIDGNILHWSTHWRCFQQYWFNIDWNIHLFIPNLWTIPNPLVCACCHGNMPMICFWYKGYFSPVAVTALVNTCMSLGFCSLCTVRCLCDQVSYL